MHFYIYNASAGSGKTYTLVKEYLKMAMSGHGPEAFRKILAMTFTNKAATEMKERVLSTLEKLHLQDPSVADLMKSLEEETGLKAPEISIKADEMLRAILHNYADFSIGTIDSFMHRVVRTFAYDLHLPVTFSVELQKENLIQQAVDDLIDQAGENPEITSILKGFTEFYTDEEKGFDIRRELTETANDLLDDQKAEAIKLLSEIQPAEYIKLRTEFQKSTQLYEQKIRAIGESVCKLLEAHAIEIKSLANGAKGIYSFYKKSANFGIEFFDQLALGANGSKTIESDKWTSATCSPSEKDAIESIKDKLYQAVEDILILQAKEGKDYRLRIMIKDSLFTMALMSELSNMIDKIRKDEHLMHISEFNRRVAEIVFHEPAPFIFERLGEKYQHYLIDEFQDTSILQWQNLLPLVQNGLATQSASLIVGDGKQAIYRFRGGDVEQFISLPEPYPHNLSPMQLDRYTLLKANQKKLPLETNYRSLPEITNWNNKIYNALSENWLTGDFQNVYKDLNQKSPAKKTGGFVSVDFLVADPENGFTLSDVQVHRILEIIRQLVDEKHYEYSDIAILTRNNKNGSFIANSLIAEEIPVISNESLLVASSSEVQLLLAWLRVLADQNTSVNLFHICSYLVERNKLSIKTLPDLVTQCRMEENEVIELLSTAGIFINTERLRASSLPEACHSICRAFGFQLQSNPFLQFFMEAVWFATDQVTPDIPSFLENWEEKQTKLSITLPQNANAVRIMTIHKSKGLQFPVVIFPFAVNETRKGTYEWVSDQNRLPAGLPSARLSISKKLELTVFADLLELENNRYNLDLINLMYVATTRPEDALYILTEDKELKDAAGWGNFLNHFCSTKGSEHKVSEKLYAWGDDAFVNQRTKMPKADEDSILVRYSIGAWQDKIQIHRESNLIWDAEDPSEAVLQGKLVHLALSWINTKDDLPMVKQRLLEDGLCSAVEAGKIITQIENLLLLPELEACFKSNVKRYSERTLILADGTLLRPDRVVETEHETIVIDYKTGKAKPSHTKQIEGYMQTLEGMGKKSLKGYLVYLHEKPTVQSISI
jgi:ATP-dependent exoDNAse (exonuclease V) beta subunit